MQGQPLGMSKAKRAAGFRRGLGESNLGSCSIPRCRNIGETWDTPFPAILVRLGLAFFQLSGFILYAARQLLLVGVELLSDGLIGKPNYLRG